jgi:molybdopterin converting factor small subunit
MSGNDSSKRESLRLLFFGHLPDLTGISGTSWPAAPGLTVALLLEELQARWPALKAHDSSIRVAVNLEYADRNAVIPAGAEVAIMPPVQGG